MVVLLMATNIVGGVYLVLWRGLFGYVSKPQLGTVSMEVGFVSLFIYTVLAAVTLILLYINSYIPDTQNNLLRYLYFADIAVLSILWLFSAFEIVVYLMFASGGGTLW